MVNSDIYKNTEKSLRAGCVSSYRRIHYHYDIIQSYSIAGILDKLLFSQENGKNEMDSK